MPFWQTFASNGKAQAGTLSGGETSLIWKVISSPWVSGLCSWFTLVSPHLNAGISRAFSLEKPSIRRSELIQASSYIAVKNLYSLQMMKLLWNFCWRLCMSPESFQNLSYRDTAAFLLFKERKHWWRKELKQPRAFLQSHLYLPPPPPKSPVGAMTFKDVGRIWAECLKVSKAEKLHDWKYENQFNITSVS